MIAPAASPIGGPVAKPSRPPRRPSARGVARHTAVVHLLRWVLPAVCLALLIALLSWPAMNPDIAQAGDGQRRLSTSSVMKNPEFVGTDDALRPVRVEAAEARQLDENRVEMALPRASLSMAQDTRVALEASSGALDQLAERLVLDGGVSLSHSNGLTLRVRRADVDTDSKLVWSVERTEASSPLGELVSNGFKVHDEGQRIEFTGPVKLTLSPDVLAGEGW